MKKLTASKLREDIYRILDKVAETGQPVEINRKGMTLKIVSPRPVSKLSRLKKKRGILKVPPEKIVHLDWKKEWKP